MRYCVNLQKWESSRIAGNFFQMHCHKHQILKQINFQSLKNIFKSRKIRNSFIDPLQQDKMQVHSPTATAWECVPGKRLYNKNGSSHRNDTHTVEFRIEFSIRKVCFQCSLDKNTSKRNYIAYYNRALLPVFFGMDESNRKIRAQ